MKGIRLYGNEDGAAAPCRRVVALDFEGVLADRDHQRAIAWQRALSEHGCELSDWAVHRQIGLGGNLMVEALAGPELERRAGSAVRARATKLFRELAYEASLLDGARELMAELSRRRAKIVVAGIGPTELEHFASRLRPPRGDFRRASVVGAFAPAQRVVEVAVRSALGGEVVLVGDSTWDARAARMLGIPALGVASGAHSQRELEAAGAQAFPSLGALAARLESTVLYLDATGPGALR